AVESVDQSPIGKTPRSNPVTYVKAFDGIRKRLALSPRARAAGIKAGFFSFNIPGGRCAACDGTGSQTVEMHFLPDVVIPCEACGGSRFGNAALGIRYRGLNVAEILALTVDEARRFFEDAPDVAGRLEILAETGLGYLRLGQSAPTLSGGESQRLKLAAHLGVRKRGRRVFLLDEPTTGLHLHDLGVLLRVLDRLVDEGHTVVVVEHHLELVRAADWVIDLGPGGGPEGGRIVAQGTPATVARSDGHTGRYLGTCL
ncbi:MAG: excinuclease ABC subunit UvrA, partial [Acidobacteriota bacterium]|nr:excinuclease ABC subunit UvrA [Acidobacteriota bacterium]